jgi:hypothetical protein
LNNQSAESPDREDRPTHQVRLPGFLIEEEVGLGDLFKKATYAMGIKPCGGCEQRAAALNRWITFSR